MPQEMTVVLTPIISGLLVLAGTVVAWGLNRVGAEEDAKRAERNSVRNSLEQGYLSVLSGVELFLRSKLFDAELDKEMAGLNAVVSLFGSVNVKAEFATLGRCAERYRAEIDKSEKQYPSLVDASDDYRSEWGDIIQSRDRLAIAMTEHIVSLRNFGK
ncbi:hypothetical protein [Pseudomonas bohemica]|uniref:hypothetical protein n=1 Tax=Pseudomonas bohemica TaxID=2044872 RepID=UPI0018FE6027|nr:hypothetical protein [Pseudomonas bohemica]